MKSKYIGAYLILAFTLILILLFFFKPEIFNRIFQYGGPGSPFVHPPSG
jgi:hypothetical protein